MAMAFINDKLQVLVILFGFCPLDIVEGNANFQLEVSKNGYVEARWKIPGLE